MQGAIGHGNDKEEDDDRSQDRKNDGDQGDDCPVHQSQACCGEAEGLQTESRCSEAGDSVHQGQARPGREGTRREEACRQETCGWQEIVAAVEGSARSVVALRIDYDETSRPQQIPCDPLPAGLYRIIHSEGSEPPQADMTLDLLVERPVVHGRSSRQ